MIDPVKAELRRLLTNLEEAATALGIEQTVNGDDTKKAQILSHDITKAKVATQHLFAVEAEIFATDFKRDTHTSNGETIQ